MATTSCALAVTNAHLQSEPLAPPLNYIPWFLSPFVSHIRSATLTYATYNMTVVLRGSLRSSHLFSDPRRVLGT